MKVFISQPMRGKAKEEILSVRKEAIEKVQKMFPSDTVEEIDSYIGFEPPAGNKSCWYLGESLKKLAEADIAVFTPGWAEAFGCTIEHKCAVGYGINTMELLI